MDADLEEATDDAVSPASVIPEAQQVDLDDMGLGQLYICPDVHEVTLTSCSCQRNRKWGTFCVHMGALYVHNAILEIPDGLMKVGLILKAHLFTDRLEQFNQQSCQSTPCLQVSCLLHCWATRRLDVDNMELQAIKCSWCFRHVRDGPTFEIPCFTYS